ncbi:MAG TPA: RluA family pseudouridine synthase [Thermoanaerobaculia bacterium]|nr:RluA family pseudouridine synthase [Thermoanaerobaculia bacterium]
MNVQDAILYEDEALIFVDKPPGIVVQRGYDAEEPVLLELIAQYLGEKGERAILMQRLDRGTSGVIFFSKLASINAQLTRHFEKKLITKTYVALCTGSLRVSQLIDAPLLRVGPISFGVREGGKKATTQVTPLAASQSSAFLQLQLLTGRTHQIRVHLAAIGHPLVGDWLYGERNAERPMLHAASLQMTHPLTGQRLLVESAIPQDFVDEGERRGVSVLSVTANDP